MGNFKFSYNIIKRDFEILKKSPFRFPEKKFYFGRRCFGTPYFYPRRWVKIEDKSTSRDEWKGKWVEKKWFGRDAVSLGWKTKFDSYRHEWNPSIIYTLPFKLQFAITWTLKGSNKDFFSSLLDDSLWEGFLTWEYGTDNTLQYNDRLISLFNKWGCTWKSNSGIEDYMYNILKPEFIPLYDEWKLNYKKDNEEDEY